MVSKIVPLSSKRSFLSIVIVMYLGLPFIFSLQELQTIKLFSFYAYLILITHCILFLLTTPFLRFKLSKTNILLLAIWIFLFCYALLSTFWSEYPVHVFQRSLLVYVTTIFLLLLILSEKEPLVTFYKIMSFLMWIGFGLSIIGILIHILGDVVIISGHRVEVLTFGSILIKQKIYGFAPLLRISSLTGNPNSLAIILFMSISGTLALFYVNYLSLSKVIFFTTIQFFALIITFSRAGIGFTTISVVLLFVFAAKNNFSKIRRTLLITLIIIIFFLIIFMFIPESFEQGIERRISQGLNLRGQIWMHLLDNFYANPLVGVGFGVSTESILPIDNVKLAAHNIHLALLEELGFLGYFIIFCFWSWGIIAGVSKVKKQENEEGRIAMLTVTVILTVLFLYQFFEGNLLRFNPIHWLWVYFIVFSVIYKTNTGWGNFET